VSDSERSEGQQAHRTRLDRRPLATADEVLDGKYRLLRPLKRGSMGELFAAENITLGVRVAVKVIRADVNPDSRAELARRLVQEAHAAFLVDHPAVIRMLDAGTTPEGDPYLVMELLRGQTLGASLAEHGPVEPAQAIRVLLPIAHGLLAAHACGVIHRDLKPNNVFLARTRDGRVQPKIIDFGLARALVPPGPRITQMGNAMGSPTYMAPEQIGGDNVTEQADIWGFSVMLYEMICGEPPFVGDTLEDLFRQILGDPPKSLRTLGRTDEQLWAIIAKGLRKEPAERWQSMRELGSALAAWLVEHGHHEDICGASLESVWIRPARRVHKSDVLAADAVPEPAATRPRRRRRSFSDISTGRWTPMQLRRRPWLLLGLAGLAALTLGAALAGYLGAARPVPLGDWRSLWPWPSASSAPRASAAEAASDGRPAPSSPPAGTGSPAADGATEPAPGPAPAPP